MSLALSKVLELHDLVDLRPHGDVRHALEHDLNDNRDTVLLHPSLGLLEGRLNPVRLNDADRLAAEALRDLDVVHAVAFDLWGVDVVKRELDAVVHVEPALGLADQPEIRVVHDDMDVW